MTTEIVAIGTEILLGEILDSNSSFIAGRLPALGLSLYRITQMGDNLERLTAFLREAIQRNDVVITTGGLGPTEDDMTREAIARVFEEIPQVQPDLEERLRAWFSQRGVLMPERNLKQTWLIPSAVALSNPRGTAPGWWVERDGRVVVALPGPPAEMGPMWEREVEPLLASRYGREVIVTRTIKTAGIGEGRVDEMLSAILQGTNPSVGIYARGDGIHVRLGARAENREAASRLIAPAEAFVRDTLGTAVWGTDDESLQEVVLRVLADRGLTLAVVEDAVTGGAVAATLSLADPQIVDRVLRGGETWPGRSGSVAKARARAGAARVRMGTAIGLGLAGDSLREEVFVAACDEQGCDSSSFHLPQAAVAVRQRAATAALILLRRRLASGASRMGGKP